MKTFEEFVLSKVNYLTNEKLLELNNNIYGYNKDYNNYIYTCHDSNLSFGGFVRKHFNITKEQEIELVNKLNHDYYKYNHVTGYIESFNIHQVNFHVNIDELINLIVKDKVSEHTYNRFIDSYNRYRNGFELFIEYKLESMDYIELLVANNKMYQDDENNSKYIHFNEPKTNEELDDRDLYIDTKSENGFMRFQHYHILDYIDTDKLKELIIGKVKGFEYLYDIFIRDYNDIVREVYFNKYY